MIQAFLAPALARQQKPFQGLKLQVHRMPPDGFDSLARQQKPFQGLKLLSLDTESMTDILARQQKPFQGLKHAQYQQLALLGLARQQKPFQGLKR